MIALTSSVAVEQQSNDNNYMPLLGGNIIPNEWYKKFGTVANRNLGHEYWRKV